ncbi:MAG: hypothetical protein ABEL97_06960 [Salinibacter sp.]
MRYARRLIFALSATLAVWVLASFVGGMLDPTRSAFWGASLLWSLLTSLLLSPALLVVAHYVRRVSTSGRNQRAARRGTGRRGQKASRPLDGPEGGMGAGDEPPRSWPEPQDQGGDQSPGANASSAGWPWIREDVEQPE